MDQATVEALSRYKQMLRQLGIEPQRIVLYGSRARGTAEGLSDIDVVVISEDFAGMNRLQRLELLGVAAARIMEPIQALGYTAEEFAVHGEGTFVGDEVKPVGIDV